MTQSGENKELKAAFDEFKELMEKRVEPIFEMPPLAPTENEAQIDPRAHFDAELKVGAPTFTIPRPASLASAQTTPELDGAPSALPIASLSATRPMTPPQWAKSEESSRTKTPSGSTEASSLSSEIPDSRRRKLAYLSLLIIISGLGGVGWVLSKSAAPPSAPDLVEQSSQSTQSIANTAPNSEDLAAGATALGPSAPTQQEPTAALAPKMPDSPSQSPQAQQPQDTGRQAVSDPQPAPLSASPLAPAPSIAPGAIQSSTPVTEPPAPTRAPTPTSQANANPEIKTPTPAKPKPKVVKAKPKIAPQPETVNARAPATTAPAAGPDTPPSPPPSPQNDSAFGFVKRTVDSITDIGRGALGGN
jgi:hypothetical protein